MYIVYDLQFFVTRLYFFKFYFLDGTTFLAEKDLNEYETHWKTPVTSNILHDQYTMYTVPPPSSGAVLQYILRIMDGNYQSFYQIINYSSKFFSEGML